MNNPHLVADGLARLTADGHAVELAAPGVEPVRLHSHPNPDLARQELVAMRAFLTAVLIADRQGGAREPAPLPA